MKLVPILKRVGGGRGGRGVDCVVAHAIVDDAFDPGPFSWRLSGGYVVRNFKANGKWHIEGMHRLVLGATPGLCVDHVNRNRLDNRRANLREVTNAQNAQNRKTHKHSGTGVRAVSRDDRKGMNGFFAVRMHVGGRRKRFGSYRTIAEAEQAAIQARAALLPYSNETCAWSKEALDATAKDGMEATLRAGDDARPTKSVPAAKAAQKVQARRAASIPSSVQSGAMVARQAHTLEAASSTLASAPTLPSAA